MNYRIKKILIFFLFLALNSCSYKSDDPFLNETTENYQLYDYYVDSYGNEGIVAYLHNTSEFFVEYIIVLSSDETISHWGPMGEIVYNCDTIDKKIIRHPSFGIAMLQSMKDMGIERFPAQAWCDQKNQSDPFPYGGSWRLPTYEEFKNIFDRGNNLANINNALHNIGSTTIDENDLYWTCVEDIDNYITVDHQTIGYDQENRAVICTPNNNSFADKDYWLKQNKYHVRAIKYIFYYN